MKKSELRQLIKEEIQLLNERTTLKSNIKKELNKEIRKITTPNNKTQYFKDVPLDHIFDILDSFHIIPVQEDNTEWAGLLVGSKGSANFHIAPKSSKNGMFYTPYDNALLALQWYKMKSGKYEINCYVS